MTRRRDLPPELSARAFRVGAAIDAGIPWDRLSASDLARDARGARAPVGAPFRDSIAAILSDGQAFAGPTAAMLWGMPLPRVVEGDPRVWVSTQSRDRAMRRPGVVGMRRSAGTPVLLRGLPVLDPVQTWCSLASVLQFHDLVAVADRIITTAPRFRALATPAQLQQGVISVRRGRLALARALQESRVGAWSRPESLLRIALVRAGLPEPELNRSFPVAPGKAAAPDLAWPQFMVCVEYDGTWHDDAIQRAADLERQELLVDAGWSVTHIRARDLFPEPLVAVSRVLRRLTARGYRHPASIHRAPIRGWEP